MFQFQVYLMLMYEYLLILRERRQHPEQQFIPELIYSRKEKYLKVFYDVYVNFVLDERSLLFRRNNAKTIAKRRQHPEQQFIPEVIYSRKEKYLKVFYDVYVNFVLDERSLLFRRNNAKTIAKRRQHPEQQFIPEVIYSRKEKYLKVFYDVYVNFVLDERSLLFRRNNAKTIAKQRQHPEQQFIPEVIYSRKEKYLKIFYDEYKNFVLDERSLLFRRNNAKTIAKQRQHPEQQFIPEVIYSRKEKYLKIFYDEYKNFVLEERSLLFRRNNAKTTAKRRQ